MESLEPDGYGELKDRFSLPSFDDLQKDLELDEIDSPFVLRELRDKFKDRFEYFSKVFESTFQPEGDFSSYIETTKFTKDMRDEYFESYKKLRYFIREAQILSVLNEIEKDADFIRKSFELWQQEKKVILDLLERLKSCWVDEEIEDSVKYFG